MTQSPAGGSEDICPHEELKCRGRGQAGFKEWQCGRCGRVLNCECERVLVEFLEHVLRHRYVRQWEWASGLCDRCRGKATTGTALDEYERRLNSLRLQIEEHRLQGISGSAAGPPPSRPPGPTNEEVQALLDGLQSKFFEMSDRLLAANLLTERGELLNLLNSVRESVRSTFCLPDGDKTPVDASYIRRRYLSQKLAHEDVERNRAGCEICGENRTVDRAHIIPREFGGDMSSGNVLILCPTHHRLFDHGALSEEEWVKIDWKRKAIVSQQFAEEILKFRQEAFWSSGLAHPILDNFFCSVGFGTGANLKDWLRARGLRA